MAVSTGPLLEGRVAILGAGREIARLLVEHGARTVLADVNGDAAKTAASEIGSADQAIGVACDVTSEDQMRIVVRESVWQFGHLDVFVNNAGVTRDASLKKMTVADVDLVMTVHLRGSWLGVREASIVMRDQKRGSIIKIWSLSGNSGNPGHKSGNPGQTNCSAAKAGIVGLTKAAAKELAHHNVGVDAVQPGLIRTPMTAAMAPEIFAERVAALPMRRAGEPAEVAGAVVFIASELSSYITGTVLEVGGGRYI